MTSVSCVSVPVRGGSAGGAGGAPGTPGPEGDFADLVAAMLVGSELADAARGSELGDAAGGALPEDQTLGETGEGRAVTDPGAPASTGAIDVIAPVLELAIGTPHAGPPAMPPRGGLSVGPVPSTGPGAGIVGPPPWRVPANGGPAAQAAAPGISAPAQAAQPAPATPGDASDDAAGSAAGPAGPGVGPASQPVAPLTPTGATGRTPVLVGSHPSVGAPDGGAGAAPEATMDGAAPPASIPALAVLTPSTAAAPTPATSTAQSVASQVVPEVTALMSRADGTHRIRLRLSPESLGDVSVVLTVRNGAVEVTLGARAQARVALEQATAELHRLLELSGARSTQVVVRDLAGSATQSAVTAGDSGSGQGRGWAEQGAERDPGSGGRRIREAATAPSTPIAGPAARPSHLRTSLDVSI